MQAERLSRLAQAWERQLEVEDGATELAFDDAGKLALAERLGGASEEQVRAAAPRMSAFSRRRRFSPSHVRARTAQLDAVLAQVDDWLSGCEAHRKQLLAELAGHPWIAPGFRDRVAGNLADSLAVMRTLRGSLAESREAFAALPLADVDDGIAPEPVRA